MRKKGFTLIELLVVIAIIALLLSIIMPSLKMAKDLARSTLCMNNQKQVGMYLAMYAQDNEEEVIPTFNWVHDYHNVQLTVPLRWSDRLFYEYQFIDSSEILYCPSSKLPKGIKKKWPAQYQFEAALLGGSAMSGAFYDTHAVYTYGLRSGSFDFSHDDPVKLTQLKSPSSFYLLSDISHEWIFTTPAVAGSHYYMFGSWHSFFMVHKKGANIVTADLAVSRYKLEDIIRGIPQQGDMWFGGPAFIFPDGKKLDANGDEMH